MDKSSERIYKTLTPEGAIAYATMALRRMGYVEEKNGQIMYVDEVDFHDTMHAIIAECNEREAIRGTKTPRRRVLC